MIELFKYTLILITLSCIQLHNVKSEEVLYPEITIIAQEDDFFLHTIKKGETLYSISRTYQVPIDDIYKFNPEAKDGIKSGSKLKIPQKAGKIQQEQEKIPEQTPKIQEESGSYHYHVIQSGETLISLSRKYGINEKDIISVNSGLSVQTFFIGKKIRIPKPENEQKRETTDLLIPNDRINLSYIPVKNPTQDVLLTEKLNKKQKEDAKKEQEEELKIKREEDVRKKQEEELKRRQEEDVKKKQKEELKIKQEEDAKKKQEEELKIKREEDVRKKQEEELKRRQEEDVKKKQKEDTKKKQEEELKQQQIIINNPDKLSGNSGSNIRRFDTDLYRYLNKQMTEESFSANYKTFLNIFGEQIIEIGNPDSAGFYKKLNVFFSEQNLTSLYKAQQNRFGDIDFINQELYPALEILLKEFPGLIRPTVYVHVSGLNQNVVVTDDVLSISLDKYMGANYQLYQKYFYNYQIQNMTPERIVPDYLLGFMMANFPYEGNPGTLLERILYEGKLRYILSRLLPNREPWEYVAYTKEQYSWCNKNDSRIWKTILNNDDLYSSDYMTMVQYLNDAPYTATISTESPGKIGVWIGFQIIDAYMKKHPKTSLSILMNFIDAQQLLKDSKYKP